MVCGGQRPYAAHFTSCGSGQQHVLAAAHCPRISASHGRHHQTAASRQQAELISWSSIRRSQQAVGGAFCPEKRTSRFRQTCSGLTDRAFGTSAVASAATAAAASGGGRNKIVFLGTPDVAAQVLQQLLDAADSPGSGFEVAAVVTQPGRRRGRGKGPTPSPVAAAAAKHGLSDDLVLTPETARDEGFLERLRSIQPDLCVTAAYGNILPRAFLDIPRHGTLNIHPSLLPRWRGAAPVPRAIEAWDTETGVSLAFTVRAMDAGPVLASERVAVDPNIQAPQLLEDLFDRGCRLLLDRLPAVWTGEAAAAAVPQDEEYVTHAPKMTKEEGVLSFAQPAQKAHNKVRAFAGWPGTSATLHLQEEDGSWTPSEVKIVETRMGDSSVARGAAASEAKVADGALHIACGGGGGVLKVLRLQPAGKKAMSVTDFCNGFVKGRKIWTCTSEDSAKLLAELKEELRLG